MKAHGNELQIRTNCLGAFLLYRLLQPILAKTAASSPEGSVRVTGAGSSALELISPKPHGMELEDDGRPKDKERRATHLTRAQWRICLTLEQD